MLGLLYAVPAAGRRYSFDCTVISPLGVPAELVCVGVPERAGERRRRRALRALYELLRENRVSRVLFEEGFPERKAVLDMGFREADSVYLLSAMAGEIAAVRAANHYRALLCTANAARASLNAATALSGAFRYVSLLAPESVREALSDVLEPFGATPEAAGAYPEVDAAIFLSKPVFPVFLPARCRVLRLCGETPNIAGGREIDRIRFTLPSCRAVTLSGRFPLVPILSAALEWGRVGPGEIKIS